MKTCVLLPNPAQDVSQVLSSISPGMCHLLVTQQPFLLPEQLPRYCQACIQVALALLNRGRPQSTRQSCEQFRHTKEKLKRPLHASRHHHKKVSSTQHTFWEITRRETAWALCCVSLLYLLFAVILLMDQMCQLNFITDTCPCTHVVPAFAEHLETQPHGSGGNCLCPDFFFFNWG